MCPGVLRSQCCFHPSPFSSTIKAFYRVTRHFETAAGVRPRSSRLNLALMAGRCCPNCSGQRELRDAAFPRVPRGVSSGWDEPQNHPRAVRGSPLGRHGEPGTERLGSCWPGESTSALSPPLFPPLLFFLFQNIRKGRLKLYRVSKKFQLLNKGIRKKVSSKKVVCIYIFI